MIFFDLEFYVPKSDRLKPGTKGTLVFNPAQREHLLLGGTFYFKDLKSSTISHSKDLWLWDFDSEKQLLQEIYQLFRNEFQRIQQDKAKILQSRVKDIITCGFGIARIDLPTLYIKGVQHNLAPCPDLFDTFLKTKIIDLANVACFLFPKENSLYPKTANQVAKILITDHKYKANGKQVWDFYDQNEFEQISARCNSEVLEIIQIYQKIQNLINNE